MPRRLAPESLAVQPLRLPPTGRAMLDALVQNLNDSYSTRSSGRSAARGLVLLALFCEQGSGGTHLAQAFRLAASDPTEQGVRKALGALRRDTDPADTEPEPTKRSG